MELDQNKDKKLQRNQSQNLADKGVGQMLQRTLTNKNNEIQTTDRFIASTSQMNYQQANFKLTQPQQVQETQTENKNKENVYKQVIGQELADVEQRILHFKAKPPVPAEDHINRLRNIYDNVSKKQNNQVRPLRHIPQTPDRVLDAPGVVADYYINIMEWGPSNMIALGLGNELYTWNGESGDVSRLLQVGDEDSTDYVTGLTWNDDGQYLAVASEQNHAVQIWDVQQQRPRRNLKGHHDRVASLSWSGALLATGSRDTNILVHDLRQKEHVVMNFVGHEDEICGLKWSPGGQQLASGGNDNQLNIYNPKRGKQPEFNFLQHRAAVKALSWCPFQNGLLVSGGGASDGCIRFWNTMRGVQTHVEEVGAQITSLCWCQYQRELISGHGFGASSIVLWKFPSMIRLAELDAHQDRVLALDDSPEGSSIASLGSDERLAFWRPFGDAPKSQTNESAMQGEGIGHQAQGLKTLLR